MNVLAICATKGRHYHLEIVVRCYLNQDYEGDSILLIFNNSEVEQKLDDIVLPENKKIILVNSPNNSVTHLSYTSVGEIFNDCLYWIKNNIEHEWLKEAIVAHFDSDDAYLPEHISTGVKGFLEGKEQGYNAYKPRRSFFIYGDNIELSENFMEPSVFLSYTHLLKEGYGVACSSAEYNWKWLKSSNLYVNDLQGTFLYLWGNGTWKISGDGENPNNFQNARSNDAQEGDRVITPAPKEIVEKIYEKVKTYKKD